MCEVNTEFFIPAEYFQGSLGLPGFLSKVTVQSTPFADLLLPVPCQVLSMEPTAAPSFLSSGLLSLSRMILASLLTHKQASLSQQGDADKSFPHFLFSQECGLQKHLNQHKSRARPVLFLATGDSSASLPVSLHTSTSS